MTDQLPEDIQRAKEWMRSRRGYEATIPSSHEIADLITSVRVAERRATEERERKRCIGIVRYIASHSALCQLIVEPIESGLPVPVSAEGAPTPERGEARCWHDRKTRSTTSLGNGRVLEEIVRCEDCGLTRVYKPCPTCGQLSDKGKR